MRSVKAKLFDASQAHLSVKLLTKAGGQHGFVSVDGLNAWDIYLFLVSDFKSRGPHQKLLLLPGSLPEPGLLLALVPHPVPLPPSHSSELWVSDGASENESSQLQPFSRD
jgi:hypothetical protein